MSNTLELLPLKAAVSTALAYGVALVALGKEGIHKVFDVPPTAYEGMSNFARVAMEIGQTILPHVIK